MEQFRLLESKLATAVHDFGMLSSTSPLPNHSETDPENSDEPTHTSKNPQTPTSHRNRPPVDHINPNYEQYKLAKYQEENENFRKIIQENKRLVQEMSAVVNQNRLNFPNSTFEQHENSDMKNLKKLQTQQIAGATNQRLAKIYGRSKSCEPVKKMVLSPIFAKNGQIDTFYSGTRGEIPANGIDEENPNNSRPRFTAFGHKTALDSNTHNKIKGINHLQTQKYNLCKSLDNNTPWQENNLHNNKLKPTLPERDEGLKTNFYNNLHDKEMKLHFPSIDIFDKNIPVSIILGGDKQNEEILSVKLADFKNWKEKLISDPNWKFHRQNSGTEQKIKLGPEFQLDKLSGILKNQPDINFLKKYPAHDIPTLPVYDHKIYADTVGKK